MEITKSLRAYVYYIYIQGDVKVISNGPLSSSFGDKYENPYTRCVGLFCFLLFVARFISISIISGLTRAKKTDGEGRNDRTNRTTAIPLTVRNDLFNYDGNRNARSVQTCSVAAGSQCSDHRRSRIRTDSEPVGPHRRIEIDGDRSI